MSDNFIFSEVGRKLEKFSYPEKLCEVICRFTECATEVFSNQKLGVLLVGSSARGELSWANNEEQVKLFSDIEFLIAIPQKNKKNEIKFRKLVSKIEKEYDFGDLFHIDYTVIVWDKLPKLEKKFFVFESKQCGIDLGNASISEALPNVTRENIKWKELNEVLLHRLTSILHAMPLSFLSDSMSKEDEQTFRLNIAKNTLDVTTWLHPYEADHLMAGFTGRLAEWDESFLEHSKLGLFISVDDIIYMNKCFSLRKQPYDSIDTVNMLSQTLSIYNKAIAYCKEMNGMASNRNLGEFKVSQKLFDEYNFKYRVRQVISMLQNLSSIGFLKVLLSAVNARKGRAINVSLYLILAALSYRKSEKSEINKAQVEFSRLSNFKELKDAEFINAWSYLRTSFKHYQNISYIH